jgi:hypothetical protein
MYNDTKYKNDFTIKLQEEVNKILNYQSRMNKNNKFHIYLKESGYNNIIILL